MLNSMELIQKVSPISKEKLEDFGDILQYAIPWTALLCIALEGDVSHARQWIYAGISTTVLTHFFKFIFNFTPLGQRPDGGNNSFPSGHTASAFMGAAFIHFYFGFYWSLIPYLLAGLTAYSRITAKKHWLRDVIAGAILAIVTVYFFAYIIQI